MPFNDKGYHVSPVAFPRGRGINDQTLEYQVEHGGSKPVHKSPKTRLTQDNLAAVQRPVASEKQAVENLQADYQGAKKPSLVLRFTPMKDGGYRVNLGQAEIHVADTPAGYHAYLVRKHVIEGKTRWRQILSAQPDAKFQRAVKNLTSRPGWFFDNSGEWRSLEWVFKSVVVVSLEGKALLPREYVTGVKSGDNLHVDGIWVWSRHVLKVRVTTILTFKLTPPDVCAARTPELPDIRNEIAYIQDVDEYGKLTKSRLTGAFKVSETKPEKVKFVGGQRASASYAPASYDLPEWTGIIKGNSF